MKRQTTALVIVLALTAAGCRTKSTVQLVTGAPDALAKKGSAKMDMKMSFAGQLGGRDVNFELKGEGAFEFGDRRGRMSFSFPEAPQLGGKQELFFEKDFVYLKVPQCPSGGLGGKGWVKYDYRKAAGLDPNSATNNDPTNFLEALRGAGEIQEVGREEVRGASTTHYKVQVDLEKALENLTEERREQAKAVFKSIGATKTTADVWIDDDNLPRKYLMKFKAGNEQSGAFEVTMTLELFDFGTKVDLDIPPADQVQEIDGPQALFALCFSASRQPAPPAQPGSGY